MKPQVVLSFAGLLMLFAPGCCVFDAIFGCGHRGFDSCGSVDAGCGCESGGHKHRNKCDKKCRKCRECLEKEGMAGGYGAGYPGMGYSDFGFSGDGGCGCGGGAATCGCGQGGMGVPSTYESSSFMTPPMTVPTPNANPGPSGTALPPPIPSTESSGMQQLPPGMQQVSMEEFQRLPGVIVSGPGASSTQSSVPQVSAQMEMSVPTVMAPSPAARPIQSVTSAPANAKQIQQTGWAPVRQ